MPKKLMDCVEKVKAQGKPEDQAFAICVDSTGLHPEKKSKKKDDVKKSGSYSAVLDSQMSFPVNLSDNILAQFDRHALPYLILLRQNLKDRALHDPVDIPVHQHIIHIFKKEPTVYSGNLQNGFGIVYEFRDRTLPIIASILASKLENYQEDPIVEEVEEKGEESAAEGMGGIADSLPVPAPTIEKDEGSEFGLAQPEPTAPVNVPVSKPKVILNVTPEGHVSLEVIKSLKEKNAMKDTLEMLDIVEKADKMDPKKKPAAGAKKPPFPPAAAADKQKQKTMPPMAADTATEQSGAEMDNDAQAPDQDGHEYIRSSDYEGGKQYWYKDPSNGQIIEKPNAPVGHPDYSHAPAMDEMMQKLQATEARLAKLEQTAGIAVGPDGQEMATDPDQQEAGELQDQEEGMDTSEDQDMGGEDQQMEQKTARNGMPQDQQQQAKDGSIGDAGDQADREVADTRKNSLKEDDTQGDNMKDMQVVDQDQPKQAASEETSDADDSEEGQEDSTNGVDGQQEKQNQDQQPKDKKKAPPFMKKDASKGDAQKQPEQKKKNPFDKMKKALQAKYPTLAADKVDELVQKASIKKAMKTKYTNVSDAKLNELVEKAYMGFKKLQGKIEDQGKSKEDAGAIAAAAGRKKYGEKDFDKHAAEGKKMKKSTSRLQRMWKVFGIEMPEALSTKDDVKKAHSGAAILKSRIMKQGKDDVTAENIVRNTLKEKYEDQFHTVVLFKENVQSPEEQKYLSQVEKSKGMDAFSVNEEIAIRDPQHMRELRQMDSDARFGQPEYKSQDEVLVKNVDSSMSGRVDKLIHPSAPDWSDKGYKEHNEGDIKKSLNKESDLDRMVKARTDANWNIPEYKGNVITGKDLVKSVDTGVNAKASHVPVKQTAIDWSDANFKTFSEDEVKKSLNGKKTKKEEEKEAVVKSRWESADKLDKAKLELIDEATKLVKAARTKEELERLTEGQRQTLLVKAIEIVKARKKKLEKLEKDTPASTATQGTTNTSQSAAQSIMQSGGFMHKGENASEAVSGDKASGGEARSTDADSDKGMSADCNLNMSKKKKVDMKKALQAKYPKLPEGKIDQLLEKAWESSASVPVDNPVYGGREKDYSNQHVTKEEGHGDVKETPGFFQEGFGGQEARGDSMGYQTKESMLMKETDKVKMKTKENEDQFSGIDKDGWVDPSKGDGKDSYGSGRKDLSDKKTI